MWHIRWRAILEPWCWVRGHRAVDVHGLHATDPSGAMCVLCLKHWWVKYEWRDENGHVRVNDRGIAEPLVTYRGPRRVRT